MSHAPQVMQSATAGAVNFEPQQHSTRDGTMRRRSGSEFALVDTPMTAAADLPDGPPMPRAVASRDGGDLSQQPDKKKVDLKMNGSRSCI